MSQWQKPFTSNMAENTANDWNSLRSFVQTDDDFQIRTAGDFDHVCLKLNADVQIGFFIHYTSTTSLTINTLHDLRIYNRISCQGERWIRIRDYFYQLIRQSDDRTSLYSIIRLIQEKFVEPIRKFNDGPTIDRSKGPNGYEDQFEILMQSIQYCDVNPKMDILPGHQTFADIPFNFQEGMYHFDSSQNQWIWYSDIRSLAFDDPQSSSDEHTCIPERCQFVTWNILSANDLQPTERFRQILRTLQSLLPDLVCLQGVTREFLDCLFEENWMQENKYYVIIMESTFSTNENQSYGQLMLMKNFRARAFQICSIEEKYIIARFGLNAHVTIDLINLHLDHSHEQRAKVFECLFQTMNTRNYMIIGDLNFGDEDLIEQNLLRKSEYQIHDLWKEIYDLDENPGYTIDSIRLRSDRYLLYKLPNLSYSIVHLNMVGLETMVINNKHINPSNHYALQLILQFRVRALTDRSALAILPTEDLSLSRGYIKLFCPFFQFSDTEDDEENLLLPLRLLLAQYQPFQIEIESSADDGIKFNEHSRKSIEQLTEHIHQLFPQCGLDLHPSLTITQLHDHSIFTQPIRFIYILQQSKITHQFPLGSVLAPIGDHPCRSISDAIGRFFHRMHLYPDRQFFEQKEEKFTRLLRCFAGVFNQETIHCFTYHYFPYGSFRLGLHGEDLDTVLVLSEGQHLQQKTELDRILLQSRYDPSALNDRLTDRLRQRILEDLNQEILDCRNIQALYPIISILFNDQTRVEIFVQVIFNGHTSEKRNLLENFHEPIHGVHDIERLISYVRFPTLFQHLLTFIRTWAQNVGIYGQVYGYLGGYSWAILCASICHKYLPSIRPPFSLDQFSMLVEKFFSTYSQFNWSYASLSLYPNHSSDARRGSMRILCPSPPFNNSSRSTINSTRDLIVQSFRQTCGKTCEEILRLSNRFPHPTIQSILQLTLTARTTNELNQWIGYMKSRLAHFLTDCEEECHLFVQTDNQIESREEALKRFYSLGFQVNEDILSRHREFYYSLNRFLEEFQNCPLQTATMKFAYKLMSRNQWGNSFS